MKHSNLQRYFPHERFNSAYRDSHFSLGGVVEARFGYELPSISNHLVKGNEEAPVFVEAFYKSLDDVRNRCGRIFKKYM